MTYLARMSFEVSLGAVGGWLAEARGVICYNTVLILEVIQERQYSGSRLRV